MTEQHSLRWLPSARLFVLSLITCIVCFVGFSCINGYLIDVNVVKVSSEEVREIWSEIRDVARSPLSIFTNNLMIATIGFTPFVGAPVLMYTFYNTAYVLSITSASIKSVLDVFPLQLPVMPSHALISLVLSSALVLSPHAMLEFIAYSLSLCTCIELSKIVFSWRSASWRDVMKSLSIRFAVMSCILLAAAFVEFYTIELLRGLLTTIP